jgi:hypothetical protein
MEVIEEIANDEERTLSSVIAEMVHDCLGITFNGITDGKEMRK